MKAFVVGSVLLLASVCAGSYIPADTPEVAAAKAAHFAAHAKIAHSAGPVAGHWDHHEHHEKWHGPIHVPVIHKGVPVETPEVQHAKAAHAAAHAKVAGYAGAYYGGAEEHHHDHHAPAAAYHHHEGGAWHGPQHIPVIHNGVPVETPEVQHAKAFHLSALHKAGAASGAHHWAPAHHEDDGSYKPEWEAHNY